MLILKNSLLFYAFPFLNVIGYYYDKIWQIISLSLSHMSFVILIVSSFHSHTHFLITSKLKGMGGKWNIF